MPAVVEQVQLAVGEELGEAPGHSRVEVAVASTEDHPYRRAEAAHLAHSPAAATHRCEQVVVETPERREGGHGLLIQLGDKLGPDGGVLDEPADLPGVEAPIQLGPPPD